MYWCFWRYYPLPLRMYCYCLYRWKPLNLIETGIVSETKYNKTKRMKLKTSVSATSNNIEKIIVPLQSRFFIANMDSYTCEQFFRINVQLLTSNRYNIDEEIARATSDAVWKTSRNIRDSIRIAKMSGSVEDVDWLVTTPKMIA